MTKFGVTWEDGDKAELEFCLSRRASFMLACRMAGANGASSVSLYGKTVHDPMSWPRHDWLERALFAR